MQNLYPVTYLEFEQNTPTISPFERFLSFLDGQMTEPTIYGWFHWLWILLIITACVVVCYTCKNLSKKQVKKVLGFTAGLMLFLELYKQFNFSYDVSSDTWSYPWSVFPFQFCSTPMYIMLIAAFCKREKFERALFGFLATYSVFAGVLVLVYPGGVFTETIGINIQTMIHHGAMIVIGALLYATKSVEMKRNTALHGAPVFAVLLFLALVMNATFASVKGSNTDFNMFYLSPVGDTPIDFLDTLFSVIPYPIILAGYAGGFMAMSLVVTVCASGIYKLTTRINRSLQKRLKKNAEETSANENTKESNETV